MNVSLRSSRFPLNVYFIPGKLFTTLRLLFHQVKVGIKYLHCSVSPQRSYISIRRVSPILLGHVYTRSNDNLSRRSNLSVSAHAHFGTRMNSGFCMEVIIEGLYDHRCVQIGCFLVASQYKANYASFFCDFNTKCRDNIWIQIIPQHYRCECSQSEHIGNLKSVTFFNGHIVHKHTRWLCYPVVGYTSCL